MFEMRYDILDETEMTFDLPHTDGLKAQGTLRGSLDGGRVALIAPASLGGGTFSLYHQAARFLFDKARIPTIRLDMYDNGEQYRNRLEFDIHDYAADLTAITDQLRDQGVRQIDAIGHSLGGLALLMTPRDFYTTTLWEPSHGQCFQDLPEIDSPDARTINGLVVFTGGNAYVRSVAQIEAEMALGDTTPYAQGATNLLAVSAEPHPLRAVLAPYTQRYIDAAAGPTSHLVIPGATHGLTDSDRIRHELYRTTAEWIDRF